MPFLLLDSRFLSRFLTKLCLDVITLTQLSQAALGADISLLSFFLLQLNLKVLYRQRFAVRFMAGTSRAICLSSVSLIKTMVGTKLKAEQILRTLKCKLFGR